MKNSPKSREEDRVLKDVFSYIDNNRQLSKAWKKRFPTWFWGKIPFTKLSWEVILFWKIREFKDGISFFEFNVNVDLYDPLEYAKFYYRPHFRIHLVVLNYTVIEIDFYKKCESTPADIHP